MKFSTDVIYDLLSERFTLHRYGQRARSRELLLPVFYNPRTQTRKGAVYVARTEDLVRKPMEGCLFFCVGPKPPGAWNQWPCEIIHVEGSGNDLLSVFNVLQHIFGQLHDWTERMQQLAATGADVRDMVRATIPLLGNRITVTNYNLDILAYCELEQTDRGPRVVMSDRYERVPVDKLSSMPFDLRRAIRNRAPFTVAEEGRSDNYCVNLFVGNDYIGCCTLQAEVRPLRAGDLELFGAFAEFVKQTLVTQADVPGGQLVTVRTVFEQLLRRYPVSRYDVDRALDLLGLNLGTFDVSECSWCCVAVRGDEPHREYPARYLCATLEDLVPRSTSVAIDDAVAMLCLVTPDEALEDQMDVLREYLEDMGFHAGASRTFDNLMDACGRYQQALAALEASAERGAGARLTMFDECALGFLMEHCCGELDPRLVIDPALARLARSSANGVDYIATLRAYLDNNCNASRTAQEMFLHRSTLAQRLEHIERYVSLDTPDRCLFLRICLHLPDLDEILRSS